MRCTAATSRICSMSSSSGLIGLTPSSLTARLVRCRRRRNRQSVVRRILWAAKDRAETSSRISCRPIFCGLAGGPAPAPAWHRWRNRVFRTPLAVGKLVEVDARVDAAIDIRGFDAAKRSTLRLKQGDAQRHQNRNCSRHSHDSSDHVLLCGRGRANHGLKSLGHFAGRSRSPAVDRFPSWCTPPSSFRSRPARRRDRW